MPRRPRESDPSLGELIDALELLNDNLDGGLGPYKAYVFVWDDEWQLFDSGGGGFNPQVHQKKYGGKYATVTLPGHDKSFNAHRTAVDAFRQLDLRILNPDDDDEGNGKHRIHVRYIGDAAIFLWYAGDDEFAGRIETLEGVVWPFEALGVPAYMRQMGYDPDDPELIDRLAGAAASFGSDRDANEQGTESEIEEAVTSALYDDGSYEVLEEPPPRWRLVRGHRTKRYVNPADDAQGARRGPPPGVPLRGRPVRTTDRDWPRRPKKETGPKKNPTHGQLTAAARQTARTGRKPSDPGIVRWIGEYPRTWDQMVKRFR